MLDPKPQNGEYTPKTWEDLNNHLQFWFRQNVKEPSAMINPDDYEMTEQEIVRELESKGYSVSKMNVTNSLIVR